MVGGFVQQQQVRFLPGQQCQRKTALLAAGEAGHRAVFAVSRKAESAEEVAQRQRGFLRGQALHVLQRRGGAVEVLQLVLGEVADADVGREFELAGGRLQLAHQQFDQRGFARPVGAEQCDARAGAQHQFYVFEQRPIMRFA